MQWHNYDTCSCTTWDCSNCLCYCLRIIYKYVTNVGSYNSGIIWIVEPIESRKVSDMSNHIYGNFAPATAFPCTKMTFWGFYFCSHFLSSGRNILKFDMKIIQQFGHIWFKTVEIWNTQVICYFSAQTIGWQAEFGQK